MEHKADTDWIKHCTMMEVEGTKPWWHGIKEDMKRFRPSHEQSQKKMQQEN